MTVALKGKQIDKKSGGGPPSKSVKVKQLKAMKDPSKVVRATFSGSNGKPAMAGLSFELKLPNGSTKKGAIGADGSMAVAGVDPGKCKLSFPDVDKPPEKKK
jgi:type VI secretion system secreted protein VgrG